MTFATMARQAISLLDLTNLNEDCTDADIVALAQRGQTPFGSVAALCIYPQFIKTAKDVLENSSIRIATVTNFPDGSTDAARTGDETAQAFADGADEVDVVIAYQALLQGDAKAAEAIIAAAAREKLQGKILKVILETGELKDEALIRNACRIALEAGADFIKTSTGKVPVNATLNVARIMLEEIKAAGGTAGFKAAGGIKTAEDAAAYLALADEMMGKGWPTPSTFRFGASGVLDDLIAAAGGEARRQAQAQAGY